MGCVALSRIRPLTPLVEKFSKSKVNPKKNLRWSPSRDCLQFTVYLMLLMHL